MNASIVMTGNLFDQLHYVWIEREFYPYLIEGFRNTIIITIGALVIGVLIGTLIAVIKYFAEDVKALQPLAKLCSLYVTVIRGIPMTVLLLIFFYIVMENVASGVLVGIVAFGVNSGAYMAELIRSGLNAVDAGQMEAGLSLGMSRLQVMQKIILPQAVRYILPAIGNELIALFKETSIAGYVAVVDLTKAVSLARNNTYNSVATLLVAALVYLALSTLLSFLLGRMERRLANDQR